MPEILDRLARARPVWRGLILVIFGALAALGQAPWEMPWVTLAVLIVILALPVTHWKAAAFNGWALGCGYFGLALHWITQPFMVDAARDGWMAPFALVLLAAGLAGFWALAFGLARGLGGSAVALVVCWTGAEVVRSLAFTGFPWALIGHIWIDTPFAQLSAYVGPHGLTLLTLAAAGCVAQLRLWSFGPVVIGTALWFLVSPGPAPDVDMSAPLIRLVQPNVPQDEKWDPVQVPLHFQSILDQTASGLAPDLVIWPETAIPWLLDQAQGALESTALAARGAAVILGVQRREDSRYYNALAVLDRVGSVTAVYDKSHLVPFGEYIPFGEVLGQFGLHGLAASQGDGFSAGTGTKLLDVPGIGLVLPLICYEGIFAEEINVIPSRARLMVLITNDAWFGTNTGPYQHFALARLRAIEQGLPMVRVANTGISGMIDARGRVLGQIALGEQGVLDLALPAALPPTVYVRLGDWPVLVLLVLTGLALIARRIRDSWRFTVDPIGTGD